MCPESGLHVYTLACHWHQADDPNNPEPRLIESMKGFSMICLRSRSVKGGNEAVRMNAHASFMIYHLCAVQKYFATICKGSAIHSEEWLLRWHPGHIQAVS